MAVAIVFAHTNASLGACVLFLSCLAMLTLQAWGKLWLDRLIVVQFTVNELFLVCIGIFMIVLSNGYAHVLASDAIEEIRYGLIGLVLAFIVFNVVCMVYMTVRTLRKHCRVRRKIIAEKGVISAARSKMKRHEMACKKYDELKF